MIADQFATNTKALENQNMLQELIGCTMFNKLENIVIKYISSKTLIISKAFSALTEQLNFSNIISDSMFLRGVKQKKSCPKE